jgi:hypothetical protein
VACGRCTRSPSKCGSCVSTRRLKGANFSRAMRSQVSSTEAKVSAEWSAKRGRAAAKPHRASRARGSPASVACIFRFRPWLRPGHRGTGLHHQRALALFGMDFGFGEAQVAAGFHDLGLTHQPFTHAGAQQAGLQFGRDRPAPGGARVCAAEPMQWSAIAAITPACTWPVCCMCRWATCSSAVRAALAHGDGLHAQVDHEGRARKEAAHRVQVHPALGRPWRRAHSTSKMPAAPMPPPMHMVTHTRLAPRRLPSISAWPVRRWPLTP